MVIVAPKRQSTVAGRPIKSFLGQIQQDGTNFLNMELGQLIYNKNMEYLYSRGSIFLSTKRGSSFVKDIALPVYGAGNYVYNGTDQFFIQVNSLGRLQYINPSNAMENMPGGGFFTPGYQHYFIMYGQGIYSTIYGCDPVGGIYKVNGSTPFYGGYVTTDPADTFCYSNISGRMMKAKGHILSYTNVQVSDTNLTNLETWPGGNKNVISPDSGTGIKFLIDNGEVTFIFKDTGIWYLPNANEDPTDWKFPKTKSDTGTKSPKTVCLAKYGKKMDGIIFLGTDKTLRFMEPRLDRNAGTLPTLAGSVSKIISGPFQNILDDIPNAYLSKCVGKFFNGLYILNIVSKTGTELDLTIVVDTEKLMSKEGNEEFPQPFWFFSDTMNYSEMVVREIDNKLYGFNIGGYINELFVDGVFTEGVPDRLDDSGEIAIPWAFYTGWFKHVDRESELVEVLLNFKVGGFWNFTFSVNSFALGGGAIPDFDSGNTVTIIPKVSSASYYDIARYDEDRYSSSGQLSQNADVNRFGEYFLFGAYNSEKNEPATFYSIYPFFKAIKSSPISTYS